MDDESMIDPRGLLDALRTSEARFRAICEAAPLGIYVSEIDVGVTYVNPAMRRIMGRTEDELRGQGWKRFLHPDDAPGTLAERGRMYDAASPMRFSARYLRSDGVAIWTQLHAAPILEGDALRGYIGVLEDVTEHRELQAQLVMAERLASVGALAAGVAHEVNTPLAVTISNLEWTQAKLEAAVDACQGLMSGGAQARASAAKLASLDADLRALRDPLRDAREAARRVSVIMEDLRLLSRPETRHEETADLERVLTSAARMASHELKHRARLVRETGALPCVQGSEARLGQVFLNLLVNAAHAMPEGDSDGQRVTLGVGAGEPGMVAIEVRDTGAGMEAADLERIFDPFFTTKAQGVGTGLGLAICHRIVDDLGGRIEVESEPGRGSVFRVLLRLAEPADHAAPTPAEPADARLEAPARGRVLIIDDDEQMRSSMALVLGEQHEVETLASARAALAQLEAGQRYDVVLCDLMMPDMSGMDLHAALEAALPEVAHEMIFLTGGAVTDAAREFLRAVPNPCIEKPFGLADLRRLVTDRIHT